MVMTCKRTSQVESLSESARSTDVIIGRTETKNKIEVGIFVPVKSYWSPYQSGFRIPVPDFKGSHNSCFLGVITSTRKSTCFLSHAISANKRTVYSKLLYREAEPSSTPNTLMD